MKRSVSTLRHSFGDKVTLLERLLNQSKNESPLSALRNEYAYTIAVILRSLYCKDASGIPLVESSQFVDDIIYPFRNPLDVFNEFKGTMLVDYEISNDRCCFSASSLSDNLVPSSYLSYYSWINEVVVDFKMEGYPPLTRGEVIKTVADKNGAHFDVNLDKYSAGLEQGKVIFLTIIINGEEYLFDCRNLLTETVLSIADEVVFSYKYLRNYELTSQSTSEFVLFVYNYSIGECCKYKYSICSPIVKKYNTNKYYPCEVTTYPWSTYELRFSDRAFSVGIIHVESYI